MSTPPRQRAASLAFVAVVAACSAVPPPAGRRVSLLDAVSARSPYESPATWRYHPRQPAALRVKLDAGAGTVLYAGARGERWLVEDGWARAAAVSAPEDIVSVTRTPDGWLFVGSSGTSYEASEPLGAFVRSSAPVDRLAVVAGAGDAIVAIRHDGRLARGSDGGAVWHTVGPEETFSDVAMLRDGTGSGLALAVPEALYRTTDAGATWARVDTPPMGAVALDTAASGIAISTPTGVATWTPAGVTQGGTPSRSTRFDLGAKIPRGANAAALVTGAATVIGARYVELGKSAKSPSGWTMFAGPLAGPLQEKRLALSSRCDVARVAGYGRHLHVACGRTIAAESMEVEFFRSEDEGRTFQKDSLTAYAHPGSFEMVVGPDGGLVVTGVCVAPARGCRARGVLYRRPRIERARRDDDAPPKREAKRAEGEFEFAPAVTPALRDGADALGISADGRIIYAVGRRTKNDALAVFVSRDGGKTFAARDIDRVELPSQDEEVLRPWDVRKADVRVAALGASEDGSLAVVLERDDEWQIVVTDEGGRVLAISPSPAPGARVSAVGLHALAVHGSTRQAWESLDGGASWASVGALPVSPCGEDDGCAFELSCTRVGCVVGDELTRSGWRGQAELGAPGMAPPEAATELHDRRVRTPIACSLDGSAWTRIGALGALPDARTAALGNVAWFEAEVRPSEATAVTFHGVQGARVRVERHELLPPIANAETFAFTYESQIEGGAVLRYPLPTTRAEISDVEVAWDNRIDGVVERARIARGGAYQPGDYEAAGERSRRAQPNLLSIAPGGVHVRLHAHARDAQATHFLDGTRSTSLRPVPWPAGPVDVDFSDITRVAGVAVPVRVVGRGSAIVRAQSSGEDWTFDASAVGVLRPERFGLRQSFRVAYLGKTAGLHVARWSALGEEAEGTFIPFTARGAMLPVAIPTPRALGDRPSPCPAARRTSTPRVVSPHLPGTRHPMVVTDANEPLRVMLTDGAVLHGTPSDPCVATFDAVTVPTETFSAEERALVPLDDLERAWLFRWGREEEGRRIAEYRTMSCRFEPTLEVPAEVLRLPGTTVLRR